MTTINLSVQADELRPGDRIVTFGRDVRGVRVTPKYAFVTLGPSSADPHGDVQRLRRGELMTIRREREESPMTIRREREESPVSSPYDMLRELRRMTSEVIALRNGRLYGIEIATAFRELDERLTEGGELPPAWATGRDDAFDREERR